MKKETRTSVTKITNVPEETVIRSKSNIQYRKDLANMEKEAYVKNVKHIVCQLDESMLKQNLSSSPKETMSRTKKSSQAAVKTLSANQVKREKARNEFAKHKHNIQEILLSSNATPFQYNKEYSSYVCCFCGEKNRQSKDMKSHTLTNHDTVMKDFGNNMSYYSYFVKLDITSLQCILCNNHVETLERFIGHLTTEHDKKMYSDIKSRIIPFDFNSDSLKCTICACIFNKYVSLQFHMNTHFHNYLCAICADGFVNPCALRDHKPIHDFGSFPCQYCSKSFTTLRRKQSHERAVHGETLVKCTECDEKFKYRYQKNDHMASVHSIIVAPPIECKACGLTFRTQSYLSRHVKRDHLLERNFKCEECEKSFFSKELLRQHMLKHSGLKLFKCDVCQKSYGKKYTLREHMRIHENDRRFKCKYCNLAFVQKCSLKGHMKSKHGEVL